MDDAIAGCDVGDDDLDGFVQEHLAILDRNGECIACEGSVSGFAIEGDDIGSHDGAWHHMVEQNVLQRLEVLWLEQVLNGASGELGEGFVGRCKDGEWSSAFEGVDQCGSLDCGNQRGEATIRNCGIDDVFGGGDSSGRYSGGRYSSCHRGGCGRATGSQYERSEQQYEQRTHV